METRSLDDVILKMWQQFGGFTPEQLQEVIESVAGINLDDFFKRYVDGTENCLSISTWNGTPG